MTAGPKDEGHVHNALASLLSSGKSVQIVPLRGPTGERRFLVDLLREDVQPLPATAWVAFQGDDLGDPPVYAADLMRRLLRVKCHWVAQASLRFAGHSHWAGAAEQLSWTAFWGTHLFSVSYPRKRHSPSGCVLLSPATLGGQWHFHYCPLCLWV
jgi:hypothetical protein